MKKLLSIAAILMLTSCTQSLLTSTSSSTTYVIKKNGISYRATRTSFYKVDTLLNK